MTLINAKIQAEVRAALADLTEPVKLVVFAQDGGDPAGCAYCADTRQLLAEVAALSDKVTLEEHDLAVDAALARAYQVDKLPALVVTRAAAPAQPNGVRFFGIPAGYEFSSLIEAIRLVSRGDAELSPATQQALAQLQAPVHIQVFVTPSCPYCPQAVVLAHRLALAHPLITADMVEAQEFPDLAERYDVFGVPRTVINDVIHVEGAQPEATLVSQLAQVLDEGRMQRLRQAFSSALPLAG